MERGGDRADNRARCLFDRILGVGAEGLRIAVMKETARGEARVAAVPETVKKFIALGAQVAVQPGAGEAAAIGDADYIAAGAEVSKQALRHADIVLGVQGPEVKALKSARPGAWIVGGLDPFGQRRRVDDYARAGFEALAMEFMPRITRAQSMDILSSQSNLAGYKAVIEAANSACRCEGNSQRYRPTTQPKDMIV